MQTEEIGDRHRRIISPRPVEHGTRSRQAHRSRFYPPVDLSVGGTRVTFSRCIDFQYRVRRIAGPYFITRWEMKVLAWKSEAKTKGADRSGGRRRSVFDYGGAERRLRAPPPFQSKSFEVPRRGSFHRVQTELVRMKFTFAPGIL